MGPRLNGPFFSMFQSHFTIIYPSFAQKLHIISHHLQCEAPKIAKLVYNSNNYGLWYL